ncbi:hypothetical protein AB9K32_00360 [Allomuricauda sp. XS_ASV26]|uniref:hypothetical protein n=1 Tax=Allomuricauda sp. XS_ASV26 TaxID=3241292 RepID=UPI003511A513
MKLLNLLIVEDDSNVIATYTRDIDSYNKTSSEVKIDVTILSDRDNAIDILKNTDNNFDGAVIDLDLKQSGGSDSSGNDVIREVKANLRFPVFVISGTSHNIDPSLKEETSFFKVRNRDDDFDFIEEFIAIYNTGITEILNRKGTIENYINDIFWNHLSSSLDLWTDDDTRSPEEKQKSLLRYTLLHLQEYLEITEDSEFENYHPSEIYITPVIKPHLFTGDIVRNKADGMNYVVLTPSCDLAQGKAKDILLVMIEATKNTIAGEKIGVIKKGKADKEVLDEAELVLKKLIHNSYSNKYHFLPRYKNIDGGLLNFQKLHSIRVKDFDSQYSRLASINSSFTKDIVARFSYYYSRQGSPDFDSEEIYNSLFE